MRVVLLWLVLLALPVAAVCWHWRVLDRRTDSGTPPSPDRMVLEIGGQAPCLRGVGLLAGAARNSPKPGPRTPKGPGGGTPPPTPAPAPTNPTPPRPEPPAPAPKNDGARTAVVGEGDTLYRIAKRELGDAGRWREIARLNQISDAGVARIKTGARLELPRR